MLGSSRDTVARCPHAEPACGRVRSPLGKVLLGRPPRAPCWRWRTPRTPPASLAPAGRAGGDSGPAGAGAAPRWAGVLGPLRRSCRPRGPRLLTPHQAWGASSWRARWSSGCTQRWRLGAMLSARSGKEGAGRGQSVGDRLGRGQRLQGGQAVQAERLGSSVESHDKGAQLNSLWW